MWTNRSVISPNKAEIPQTIISLMRTWTSKLYLLVNNSRYTGEDHVNHHVMWMNDYMAIQAPENDLQLHTQVLMWPDRLPTWELDKQTPTSMCGKRVGQDSMKYMGMIYMSIRPYLMVVQESHLSTLRLYIILFLIRILRCFSSNHYCKGKR